DPHGSSTGLNQPHFTLHHPARHTSIYIFPHNSRIMGLYGTLITPVPVLPLVLAHCFIHRSPSPPSKSIPTSPPLPSGVLSITPQRDTTPPESIHPDHYVAYRIPQYEYHPNPSLHSPHHHHHHTSHTRWAIPRCLDDPLQFTPYRR
ncbi:unnamed protein product, partial [Tuber aestivum]